MPSRGKKPDRLEGMAGLEAHGRTYRRVEWATAVSDYFAAREHRRSKGARADLYVAEVRILPELGDIELSRLTAGARLSPYREVDAARVQFLSAAECVRIVNACGGAFLELVRAALLTGCRYGELTGMKVADYSPESGMGRCG